MMHVVDTDKDKNIRREQSFGRNPRIHNSSVSTPAYIFRPQVEQG